MGGIEQIPVDNYWTLHATILWKLGYRRCSPKFPAAGAYPNAVPAHQRGRTAAGALYPAVMTQEALGGNVEPSITLITFIEPIRN
jgi:hypothetical protein